VVAARRTRTSGEVQHLVDVERMGVDRAIMVMSSRTLGTGPRTGLEHAADEAALTAFAASCQQVTDPCPVGETEHHVDGRGLAGALAEQRDDLARGDGQVDRRTAERPEGLGEVRQTMPRRSSAIVTSTTSQMLRPSR